MKPAVEILLGMREAPAGSRLKSLDAYADSIRASYAMNIIRWPRPAKPTSVANTGNTLERNIEYIRTFMTDRYAFLSEEWK